MKEEEDKHEDSAEGSVGSTMRTKGVVTKGEMSVSQTTRRRRKVK